MIFLNREGCPPKKSRGLGNFSGEVGSRNDNYPYLCAPKE